MSDQRVLPAFESAIQLEFDPNAVAVVEGRTIACSLPVWLRAAPLSAFPSRRWVKLRYRSSFFDDAVRPLIRFETAEGRTIINPMNGAVLGAAEWTGDVPANTVAVSISPVQRLGPFDFVIDSIAVVTPWQFLRNAMNFASGLSFRVGAAMTPLQDYRAWHRRLARPIDLRGIDRPRTDWRNGAIILLVLSLADATIEDIRCTLGSLESQAYTRWLLCAFIDGADNSVVEAYRHAARTESRLLESEGSHALGTLSAQLSAQDAILLIRPGDVLPDNSLAMIAETLASNPEFDAVYGDEDAVTRDGVLHSPMLKPNWSPVFQRGAPYLGRSLCVRFGKLGELKERSVGDLVSDDGRELSRILGAVAPERIGHIRRILYRRSAPKPIARKQGAQHQVVSSSMDFVRPDWPEVTIVVPTRDMAKLLHECVTGLQEKTDYPRYRVVIVDNGSTRPDALALLAELRKIPKFAVVESPAAFNFSALCNQGARHTASPVLVFLNNDVAMIDNNWLKPLVHWALQPKIGAVGAKLLFPSGTIQHAGVVVGLGGIGGHFYRMAPADLGGYLARLRVPHEVSAVTGACIAVERAKFQAIGGFDAKNLPVELNDLDFCLRLAECGWTNLWTPESVLQHREYGSRRIGLSPPRTYRRERNYFVNRWQHVIRDDPYFHPALSLYAYRAALA